jgi:hypothetical protein
MGITSDCTATVDYGDELVIMTVNRDA